ncbi:MAG: hypothetical protein V2J10_07080, partial [Wenzhouxiangella sp.]|nr:hypothetical protein [Wenzhouxiangella sp.]
PPTGPRSAGNPPQAGAFASDRFFGFFCIDWQKKLAQKARRAWAKPDARFIVRWLSFLHDRETCCTLWRKGAKGFLELVSIRIHRPSSRLGVFAFQRLYVFFAASLLRDSKVFLPAIKHQSLIESRR